MKKITFLYPVLLLSLGCSQAPRQKQKNDLTYFDIKGYFDKEARRLQKSKTIVAKTVSVQDGRETKKVEIADWKKELSSFIDADVNRDAWKGAFAISQVNGQLIYTSDNEKVPVKEIRIDMKNEQLKGLRVIVKNSNTLYTSVDSLFYYPDSLYRIKKVQKINLMSEKRYEVSGIF